MSHLVFVLLPVLVIVWIVWGTTRYKQLKLALQAGQREALLRGYRRTIIAQWMFGILSVLAVGPSIFYPLSAFHLRLARSDDDLIWGVLVGLGISFLLGPLLARRAKRRMAPNSNITALLPQTSSERRLFAVVAISAGICEELLFRGYGLRLFADTGLTGLTLLFVAALAFGLGHVYQGIMGIMITGLIGFMLSVAYIMSGSLLLPVILHTIIDLRLLMLVRSD